VVNPIIVALDFPTLEEADRMAGALREHVGGYKVGMELLMGEGPQAVTTIARHGVPVFVDAKLHDIPNTVAAAAGRIRAAGARWVTVHSGGGREMIEAANEGMEGQGVLVVTVLTSLSDSDLAGLGISVTIAEQVEALSLLAAVAAAEGVVCSPAEISRVKQAEPGLKVFTPGVRLRESTPDDQKRTATPEEAVLNGADHLVIGRPITRADDPVEAARKIAASIAS
jgi:orotidine-5'-phosphate decarboxylase